MACIFAVDGEEGNAALAWSETSSTSHDGTRKDGTFALMQSDGNFYAKKIFTATYTEWFGSCFFRHSTSAQSFRLISWYHTSGTTELGSIRWNNSNKHFEIYTGTTLQATGTVSQQAANAGGDWYNLNFRILLHGSTGNIAVRHEGSTSNDVSFTGNTLPTGSNMDAIQIMTSAVSHDTRVDNFFLCDTSGSQNNTWPGVVRAYSDRPTGKSATNDSWTADSGSNKFDRINESTWNNTTYVYSETNGQKQGFTYGSVTFTGTILAVVINDVAEKITTGGLKQGVRIASTDYPSATKSLKTTVTRESLLQEIFELNPNTAAAWTTSDNPETYLEKTA